MKSIMTISTNDVTNVVSVVSMYKTHIDCEYMHTYDGNSIYIVKVEYDDTIMSVAVVAAALALSADVSTDIYN